MRGCFRVAASMTSIMTTSRYWIPKKLVMLVSDVPSKEYLSAFCRDRSLSKFVEQHLEQLMAVFCVEKEEELFPFYIFSVDQENWYIVHPEDNQSVRDFISGADDPMRDFVNVLQYSPDLLLSNGARELREAEERHYKRIKLSE